MSRSSILLGCRRANSSIALGISRAKSRWTARKLSSDKRAPDIDERNVVFVRLQGGARAWKAPCLWKGLVHGLTSGVWYCTWENAVNVSVLCRTLFDFRIDLSSRCRCTLRPVPRPPDALSGHYQRRYDTGTSMIQLSYIILWLSDKILVITRALIRSWGARVVPPLGHYGLVQCTWPAHGCSRLLVIDRPCKVTPPRRRTLAGELKATVRRSSSLWKCEHASFLFITSAFSLTS